MTNDITAQAFREAASQFLSPRFVWSLAPAELAAVQKAHTLLLAAAEQREQLDVCQSKATGYEVAILNLTSMLNRTEQQLATLTAERGALTAANKSLDAHCMVLQHDIRTCLAESDDAPREQLLGELSQQVVDLGLWNASQREQLDAARVRIGVLMQQRHEAERQIATLTAELIDARHRIMEMELEKESWN